MSLPRYPAYKVSGMEWFGEIPQHWDVWKLTHAFDYIGSGTTPKSENAEYYSDGDVFWLNTGDLNDGELFSCNKKISNLALLEHSALRIYPADSLAIAMYGATIGKLALLKFETTVNQACCVFGSSEIIRIEFLFYLLLGFRERIISLAIGGGQPNINQDILRSLKFPSPILDEQTLIVTFLDRETAKIDELIAEQEKLITLLDEKRKTMISHTVTKGLNPDAPMKDSGMEWLGEVPEHWNVPNLNHYSKLNSGTTPDRSNSSYWNGDIPWLKTGEIRYELIVDSEEKITQKALADTSLSISPKGTLLMAMYGQGITRGRVAILGIAATYNQACVAIQTNERILNTYLQYFFIAGYSVLREGGNLTSQMNLNSKLIGKFKILLPPISEQTAIVTYLDQKTAQLETLKAEAQRGIDLLKERRSALISAAVTGKIDVRGLVNTEAA